MNRLAQVNKFCAVLLPVAALVMFGSATSAEEWSLDKALDQIEKATRDVRGISGEVTITDERAGKEAKTLAGKVAVLSNGRLRIDVPGDDEKTILCTPSTVFIHEPKRSAVREYKLSKSPDKLAQYALLGFAPKGEDLKKDYIMTLVGEDTLDERSILLLELTPKSDELRATVSKIQLWIDQANWLPLQQRIFHSAADTHLTVRYANLIRNDELDKKLFEPEWPKGTRKEKE